MDKKYIKRLIEKELYRKLNSSGCVLITGPKFCGKSTMCEQYAKSILALKTTNSIELANIDPKSTLKGDRPHLIDEWQKAPEIWNQIKDDLDNDYEFGKYILTGSTTPIDESVIQHSGAGRISTLSLKPFTLYESGESSGKVSIHDLANGKIVSNSFETNSQATLSDIAFMICRGGWPIAVKAEKEFAIDVTKNYFEGLFRLENESDDFSYFLRNKDIELLELIIKSYARNISTQCKKSVMISDIINSGARSKLDEETFNSYLNVLKKLYIVYDMPAWNLNLRSSSTVRVAPTHHFTDTSIATAALNISPGDLLNDIKSFGLFFEDMAVRDLSVYAEVNHATLKHYRDSSGQEIDVVMNFTSGEYGLIEIKLASAKLINEAINSLNSFEKKLYNSNLRKPIFKMVLVSHGPCYMKDGVAIVPITELKD